MTNTTTLGMIISIIIALGGWEAIKYFLDWVRSKKKDRMKNGEVEFDVNFKIFKEQIEFLSIQVTNLQNDVNAKAEQVLSLNIKINKLQGKVDELMIDKNELIDTACFNMNCQNRCRIKNNNNKNEL